MTKTYGVPGMKYMMDLMGYYGGPCRSPLQPLNDADKAKIKDIFVSAGFLN